MRITVIGAGAIGSLVAGYLEDKHKDVLLIGNPASAEAIKRDGLSISGARGDFKLRLDTASRMHSPCDLAVLAVKTQDVDKAIKDNLDFIRDSVILTTQNGVQADNLVARYIPKEKIISSIVMFGSTCIEPAKVVHNFEGSWIIGKQFCANDKDTQEAAMALGEIFPVVVTADIQGMKYLKVFVNANNCVPALLGISMQEAFADINISRVSIAIWREGFEIVSKAGIKLVSLPDFPLERLTKLLSLPSLEAAKIFSGIMVNLSKEPLYGSILQSIKRKRPSEIDYINGEFVNIARQNGMHAALNESLVELVHQVEQTGRFISKEALLEKTKDFIRG
jgi:2-dehydropantoate 2-reductase